MADWLFVCVCVPDGSFCLLCISHALFFCSTALRVPPAEARLTVYRRLDIGPKNGLHNCWDAKPGHLRAPRSPAASRELRDYFPSPSLACWVENLFFSYFFVLFFCSSCVFLFCCHASGPPENMLLYFSVFPQIVDYGSYFVARSSPW